jgi:hypothetical protein
MFCRGRATPRSGVAPSSRASGAAEWPRGGPVGPCHPCHRGRGGSCVGYRCRAVGAGRPRRGARRKRRWSVTGHGCAALDGVEESATLVLAEDGGQGPGPLAEGKGLHHGGALQGDRIEETQGADRLVELAPRDALLEQVQRVLAHVLGAEVLGRLTEVSGEQGDAQDVGLDGAGRVVAQLQVLGVALSQGGSGDSSGPRAACRPSTGETGECLRARKSARAKRRAPSRGRGAGKKRLFFHREAV